VWLAFGHRVGAVIVSGFVIALAVYVLRRHRGRGFSGAAWTLLVLLCVQLTLGVLTVLLQKPADIASGHVAVGALVLVTTFVLAVRSMRGGLPSRSPSTAFEVIDRGGGYGAAARPAV